MHTNGKKNNNVKIFAPAAVSNGLVPGATTTIKTPRQAFEELLGHTKDPVEREALFRELIRLLDAELASERTEVKRVNVGTYTITQVALALVSGILNNDAFFVNEEQRTIKLPNELTEKVKGMKFEIGTTDTGDVVVRIRERGNPDDVIVRGSA